jgi:hypothetical protein
MTTTIRTLADEARAAEARIKTLIAQARAEARDLTAAEQMVLSRRPHPIRH